MVIRSWLRTLDSGNNAQLEGLFTNVQRFAEDLTDTSSQRSAFQFFSRSVNVWVAPIEPNGNAQVSGIPGFERFAYERLVPTAFSVLSSSQFNLKDGQMLVVSVSLPCLLGHKPTISPRYSTKYAISCKVFPKHEVKKPLSFLPRCSSLHKAGPRTPPSSSRPR